MLTGDRLDPFPAAVLGSSAVLVDRRRPVAVVRGAGGSVRVATWPNAPLPPRAATAHLRVAVGCVWVVYTQNDAEPGDASASTAVRIGADGQVAWCELGALVAIGADEVGVWACADLYLAMGDPLAGQDDQGPQEQGKGPAGPPDWVDHAPVESWEDYERAQHQAAVEHFPSTAPPGVEQGQGFGWFAHTPAQQHEPVPLPAPPPPSPSGAVTLCRVRADGGRDQVTFSRVVSRVSAPRAGVLRMVFHPTGAAVTQIPGGHGYLYDYLERVAEVDVSQVLPAVVDLDALASRLIADDDRAHERGRRPAVQEGDRVDLSALAGTRWHLRFPGQGEVAAAVQAVFAQYAGLGEPGVVHTSHDDRWHRVSSDYADVDVHVEGEWPTTEVVVDFTHRLALGQRLRRRTRVFDDAGAPAASRHLAVYLEETLATTDLDRAPVREGRRQV